MYSYGTIEKRHCNYFCVCTTANVYITIVESICIICQPIDIQSKNPTNEIGLHLNFAFYCSNNFY